MPRGQHFRKVKDDQIVAVFDRDDLDRPILTPDEVAEKLTKHTLDDGEEITGQAVRQRLLKMKGDEVETMEMGGATLWKKKGATVFAQDGGYLRLSDYRMLRPIIALAKAAALVGFMVSVVFTALSLGGMVFGLSHPATVQFIAAIGFFGVGILSLSIACLVYLSAKMHPSEAPLRKYLYKKDHASGTVQHRFGSLFQ